MATAAPQMAIAEHLQCTVCLNRITDSRQLMCQHTFCLACLNRRFHQYQDQTRLNCPSCHQQTHVPDTGPAGLPKNRLVNQLVEALQASQDTRHTCEDCDEQNAAAGYCENCAMLLCDGCAQAHLHSKRTRGHSILAIHVYEKRCRSAGHRPSPVPTQEPKCVVHDRERTEAFCKTCDKAICSKCADGEHKTCAKGDLDDICAEKKATIKKLINQVDGDVIKPIQSAINAAKQGQDAIIVSADKAKRDITHYFEECEQLLQKRKDRLLSEVDIYCTTSHNYYLRCLKQLIADLHNAMQITDASKHISSNQSGAISAVISDATDAIDRLTNLQQTHEIHQLHTQTPITFSACKEVDQDFMNNMGTISGDELINVCTPSMTLQNISGMLVAMVKSAHLGPPVILVKPPEDGAATEVAISKHGETDGSYLVELKTRAVGKHKVHIRVNCSQEVTVEKSFELRSVAVPGNPRMVIGGKGKGDYQFNYPWGVTMCDDHVLVADSENHRLQEFDVNGQLIQSFRGEANFEPAAAALHPSGVVLATDHANHRVQVFNRNGQALHCFGSKGSQPGQYIKPQGIGVTSDGHVVVSDCGNRRLQVIDITGTSIRQFSSCGQGRSLERPAFIAVNPVNDHIFVADNFSNIIEEFTKDGQHIHAFGQGHGEEIDMTGCFNGVALHPSGHLLVAEYHNRCVSIFTREGEFVGLCGEVEFPIDVACSKDGQVFVSQGPKNCVNFY